MHAFNSVTLWSQQACKIKKILKKLNRQKRRFVGFIGAGEGIRTLDFNLGKVAEYFGAWPYNHFFVSVFSLSKFISIMRLIRIEEIKVATESPKNRCKQIINL